MTKKCEIEGCRIPKSEMLRDACEGQEDVCNLEMINIEIDNHKMQVPKGTTILEAAKGIGVKIPTLCNHDDLCLAGVCRICLVEVEGFKTLQASCSYSINEFIKIKTNTAKIRRSRRNVLELLLTDHVGECYACVRNGKCELQDLAMEYGIDSYPYGHENKRKKGVDCSSHAIIRDMDKCILCRRCVRSCIDLQEVGVYSIKGRGKESAITTFGDKPMDEIVCINCGQCINRCPTGALYEKDDTPLVWKAIENPNKHVVIQTAPAPRAGIGEEFGLEPGTPMTLKMNTALRRCGFDKIFDTCFTADLTIIEEGTELLKRIHNNIVGDGQLKLPVFTSCSPGWVKYLEHFFPEFLDNLSTAKSPQQMFGTIIKTYYAEKSGINPEDIVTVALMPCTAKKYEAERPEMCQSGFRDVDYGITTREVAKMFKETGIDLPNIEDSDFDDPFTGGSGSGVIFGATGGVMESAIRTVYELVSGEKIDSLFEHAEVKNIRGFKEVKSMEIKIENVSDVPELLRGHLDSFEFLKGQTLKVAVCHGTSNAKLVLENIRNGGEFSNYHFIEFMACPGGCLGGGGQPLPTNEEIRTKRANAIYSEDRSAVIRKSYENPGVLEIYKNFLKEGPGKEKAHHLLHTHYKKRGKEII
jgi:NADH-quinone oxidoreductase subunit G/[NiFe] hydrogenase diaphorase moiety small subunit